jgi:endonuclease YncB( thermonuclease family)
MKKSAVIAAALSVLSAFPAFASDSQKIVGKVGYIMDGDTFTIGDTNIRLWGIDAPETKQQCREPNGKPYSCGIEAKDHLSRIISGRVVTCHQRGFNQQRGNLKSRTVAQCYVDVDRSDLGRAMVLSGYAFRTGHAQNLYADAQRFALKSDSGLWQGSFQEPWHWRKANR